jgi:hypothetical protein
MKPTKRIRLSVVVQLGILAFLIMVAINYQSLDDDYTLATYKPTAQVTGLESRVTLTRRATAILDRTLPQFDSKSVFNTDCDTQPHELELGCFYRGRIFVLTIDNKSLAPEMDVVASHELLHAVWSGMSSGERESLGNELERVYAGIKDPDLQARMQGYAKSEPGEEANELHSILGTEVANLSPILEAHYAKYFANRQQIVKEHANYQSVFDTRRSELEAELVNIRDEKGQLAVINRQLENYRTSNQISSYNQLVPRQNQMVDTINSQISTYQAGVDEYNALSKSLDSQQITDTETSAQ